MAASLRPEQWSVIKEATRAPSWRKASPKVRKALIEALGVESGYRDLNYGDRDSVGALQQRPSQGWGPPGETVAQDAEQFLQHAIPLRGKYATAGELAQAVQRSAFPSRYGQRGGEARAILRALGGQSPVGAGSTPQSATPPTPGATISAAVQPRQLGGVTPPAAPQFAAQVVQPSGYTPAPGVNSSPGPDLRQQLQDSLTRNAPAPYEPAAVPLTTPNSGPGTVERRPDTGLNYGRVVVAPGANRGGVTLQKPVVNFLRKTAGFAQRPIQVTTGTNHNQYVAGTNRVSDHWAGNAVDIAVPVDSARGDLIAESAFRAAGVSTKKARQMAQNGGLYNLNVNGRRLQVIWKTNEGGNHHDHVHIGYR